MYVWKLWRDSCTRVLACLVLGVGWVAGILYFHLRYLALNEPPTTSWSGIAAEIYAPLIITAILTALVLCDVCLGTEFMRGTAEVLLTRPRPRAYFAWTGWLFGAIQLLALMTLMDACFVGVLAYKMGGIPNWRLLALPVLLLPAAALLFGLGYLISIFSNGRYGAVLTFGLLLVYFIAVAFLADHWHIRLPHWWFGSLPRWAIDGRRVPERFPAIPLLSWLAFTLVFPALAQYSLRRKQL